jgi:hypothetical protein
MINRLSERSERLRKSDEFERRMPWFPPPDPAVVKQRRQLELELDREVPDWRQINNDPQWIGWLSGTHLYSDRARQFHLDDAVASGNVHRVAQFFKDFIAQRNATQPRPASTAMGLPGVAARQTYLQPQRHHRGFPRLHARRVQGP